MTEYTPISDDALYVNAFPKCKKVVIDWPEGEPTTVSNPHLYFQKEGCEPPPPPKPPESLWGDWLGKAVAERFGKMKHGQRSYIDGDPDSPCKFDGLSDMITTGYEKEAEMNVYFGTVVYVPEEGEAQILFEPHIVTAKSLDEVRKKLFAEAVRNTPPSEGYANSVPAERLYVYALELKGEN